MTEEELRLAESATRQKHWKRWGPYLSERAWGTVREDYSPNGNAWEYLPHDHARSRAYRWNEDGIAGISDRRQIICFALALWNERDPILKERLFGLTGNEGNHGEDVKEYYFYLDSTPSHSYMKYLYKYSQAEFPYAKLVDENRCRDKRQPEFELLDTGVFDEDRYFDVFVEYAKAAVEDILIKITVTNRGPESADLRILPTIWFRNTWSWGNAVRPPQLHEARSAPNPVIELNFPQPNQTQLDRTKSEGRWLHCEGSPELLFTENETNARRLFGTENRTLFVKDGINDHVVQGVKAAVNPEQLGSKAAAHYKLSLGSGETVVIRMRLADSDFKATNAFDDFDKTFVLRLREADEFYATVIPQDLSADAQNVMRQGFAGMLWSKQFYHYVVKDWLRGDPDNPRPPEERRKGRNHQWAHLYNADVISMPDKWEYPWYAAWDLAFHCIPLALVDPEFAKEQLVLMLREWYMHPNGQIPAYEWAFGDVNPPVNAWAAWRVYKIDKKRTGTGDREFLKRIFHKLMLNFTWWVNRKDADGMNIFQGGFLGLDNIGVFDRGAPLPTGGYLEQSDGTSWMAMYTLNLPYGIRGLSQFHREHPYVLHVDGTEHRVDYEPGESSTGLFGGNSNWRGPIWFPVNFLLVESLQKFHHYLGDDFTVEFPTGSGNMKTLWEVAGELSRRMTNIFLRDEKGRRPVFGNLEKFQTDPHWRDLLLFHEYFHGDSGSGVGASHQTGWTGVVTKLMQQSGEFREGKKTDPAVATVGTDRIRKER